MRWDIINYLIRNYNYSDYLEIGVQDYYSNCAWIEAPNKVTIDPAPRSKCDYIMTSDEYFAQISKDTYFDIIFVDGLHHNEQVYKDITNSLKHLRDNGTIVVHDCLPTSEIMQQREDYGGPWTGDVWKTIVQLKSTRKDLDISTVDHDYGCGIVRKGKQQLIPKVEPENLTWTAYQENYKTWLGVITLDEFYIKYEKA